MPAISNATLNVAAYKFAALKGLEALRTELLARGAELGLKGTILLSPEGINLFLAGEAEAIDVFQRTLSAHAEFADLEYKESWSARSPFARFKVKLKREIIPLGENNLSPTAHSAPRLAPEALKRWLDEGREVVLLDTRNTFEVRAGTFKNARELQIAHFRDFPRAAQALPIELKQRPVITFCTGGIRCEKAAPVLIGLGFREVYQLDGGILKYFERCGDAHFEGACVVFDERGALDAGLRPVPNDTMHGSSL